jgi:hypothetical protein
VGYLEVAKQFIEDKFSDCIFALVAGSVVSGESTSTSDLDIFIIRPNLEKAYRESFFKYGWPIEAFVHNLNSYKDFFHNDVKRRRPSLPKMCSEGIVIRDLDNMESTIKDLANKLLNNGPAPFSNEELTNQRYAITDLLDDLIGANKFEEQMFIIHELSEKICNFVLVNRGQWMGRGKWIPRLIRKLDEEFYNDIMISLEQFYRFKDKEPFIDVVLGELGKYGGRLFEGYALGKD